MRNIMYFALGLLVVVIVFAIGLNLSYGADLISWDKNEGYGSPYQQQKIIPKGEKKLPTLKDAKKEVGTWFMVIEYVTQFVIKEYKLVGIQDIKSMYISRNGVLYFTLNGNLHLISQGRWAIHQNGPPYRKKK